MTPDAVVMDLMTVVGVLVGVFVVGMLVGYWTPRLLSHWRQAPVRAQERLTAMQRLR